MKTKFKVGITVNTHIWDRFEAVAKERGTSRSNLIEQHMRQAVEAYEKAVEEKRAAAANSRRR